MLTAITLAAAAGSVVWAVAAGAAPPRWYAVPRVPLAGSLLVLVPVPALLAATAVANLFDLADPFTADWLVRLDPEAHVASPLLLPLAVAVVGLAAALTVPRPPLNRYAMLGIVLLTALLTAAQYPLPLVAFVAVLGPFGLVLAFPSAVLTLLVLGEITLLAAYVMLRRSGQAAALAGLVLPAAMAGFVWTGGHLLDVPYDRCSLVTLLVLGLLALAVPRLELELVAALAVLLGSASGIPWATDPSVSLAVHLTLAGALVTVSSLLHRDHRPFAWLGGLLLAAATWVRLYDVGVHAPEAYTLPTAVALVAGRRVPPAPGLRRRHDDHPAARAGAGHRAVAALGPGRPGVAPGRAARVPAAWCCCWAAPRCAGPLRSRGRAGRRRAGAARARAVRRADAAVGAHRLRRRRCCSATGITWEARLRDLRQAAAYLGRLR